MTAVIDDAPLIADLIFVGDREPTPDDAGCLAEYVRGATCEQLKEDRDFWRDEAKSEAGRASSAESKADELEGELDKAKKELKDLKDKVEKLEAQVERFQSRLNQTVHLLREASENMAGFADELQS